MTADQLIAAAAHGVAHIDDPRTRLAEQVGRLQGTVRMLADKLAPYLGVKDKNSAYCTVYAGGVELPCEYEFTGSESPCFDVESPGVGPGHPAEVSIYAVLLNGQWIEPSEAGFSEDQIDRWTQWILDSEIESAADQRDAAMAERAERRREDRFDWSAA